MKLRRNFAIWVVAMFLTASELFAGPAITWFTPTVGSSIDGYITIHGSGFWPFTTLIVRFNNVQASYAGVTTEFGETVIKAQVAASTPLGANPIYVEVDGAHTWSVEDFTVIGSGPYITGFTPSSGGGGTSVTISGAHFDNGLTVNFNGLPGQITVHNSYTNVVVNAPAGVTTGPISATTANGTYTTGTNLYFYAPPSITGFSPGAGRRGTNVIITGNSLLGTSVVKFGALDAASFNVMSNGAIQAVAPAGATSSLIRGTAPAGTYFSSGNFVVRPTITNFSPMIGNVGTNVTISGENLFGTTAVKFNNTSATFSSVTYGQLSATVPSGATTGFISVTTTNGGHTNENYFYLPPSISSFTPNNSAPGARVKITGINFIGATDVSFDGVSAGFTVTNNTTIGATVPDGVTTGPIRVTGPAGTATSSQRFYGAPVITGFTPTSGLPNDSVTISGTNFLDVTAVRFGITPAVTFAAPNNNTINATVPTNAQTGPITVVTPGGTNTSAANFVLDYTANLGVTVTDLPDPVTMTSNLTYTIVVTNRGPYYAPGVTLTEMLPASVVLKSATAPPGTLNTSGNPITGTFGDLAVSNSVTVTLVVTPQTAGTISNFGSVASLYPDPNPDNNTAVNFTTVEPFPLLSIRLYNTNRVQIAWPSALTSYNLQFRPSLATSVYWSNVTTAPQTIGNESVVTETNVGGMKYYRLKK